MSETTPQINQQPKARLRFIDMGRSLAILLMLEGHFIEMMFRGFAPMKTMANKTGSSGSFWFDIWYFVKGLTAPMFFTVTGLVFVYLLAKKSDIKFWDNIRVKKGGKRVLELLFWGYLLQLSVYTQFDNYLNGDFGSWIFAFHVLQSIGLGILGILLIYGLYKLIKIGPLFLYYFVAGTLVFCFYPSLKALPKEVYLPAGAPEFIQNVIHGKYSVFPIVPWMAFTLYGGMVGALIVRFQSHVKKVWFPLLFVAIGLIAIFYSRPICISIDGFIEYCSMESNFVRNAWLYTRLGQIFIILGILMLIEKYVNVKDSLFLKVGQNTLPIYVIHVIILYGGITGIGLKKFAHTLGAWESIIGAALFIALFVVFVKYLEFFERIYSLDFLKKKKS